MSPIAPYDPLKTTTTSGVTSEATMLERITADIALLGQQLQAQFTAALQQALQTARNSIVVSGGFDPQALEDQLERLFARIADNQFAASVAGAVANIVTQKVGDFLMSTPQSVLAASGSLLTNAASDLVTNTASDLVGRLFNSEESPLKAEIVSIMKRLDNIHRTMQENSITSDGVTLPSLLLDMKESLETLKSLSVTISTDLSVVKDIALEMEEFVMVIKDGIAVRARGAVGDGPSETDFDWATWLTQGMLNGGDTSTEAAEAAIQAQNGTTTGQESPDPNASKTKYPEIGPMLNVQGQIFLNGVPVGITFESYFVNSKGVRTKNRPYRIVRFKQSKGKPRRR